VAAGLYMLTVWLIENDATRRGEAKSQLPSAVVFTHLILAVSGLVVWVVYLLADQQRLAWIALGTLTAIALLGLLMFARWIPVHRGADLPVSPAQFPGGALAVPPEGNIPEAVVACHGAFALITYVLVLLTTLNVGGS
jgi:hypothetical protein